MNKETALMFLKNHQPMPQDHDLDENLISAYDEVRKYFLVDPVKECLPLLLNSFGKYDGYGVYQLVEDVILKFEHDEVVCCLKQALESRNNGVKYWCAQICSSFPDKELICSLTRLLNDSNEDIKISAITALSEIDDISILDILKKQLKNEKNEGVKNFLMDVIEDLKDS